MTVSIINISGKYIVGQLTSQRIAEVVLREFCSIIPEITG